MNNRAFPRVLTHELHTLSVVHDRPLRLRGPRMRRIDAISDKHHSSFARTKPYIRDLTRPILLCARCGSTQTCRGHSAKVFASVRPTPSRVNQHEARDEGSSKLFSHARTRCVSYQHGYSPIASNYPWLVSSSRGCCGVELSIRHTKSL